MGLGGSEGEGGIEGAKAARLECMCCRPGTVRGPHSVSSPSSSLPCALQSRHTGTQLTPCLLLRDSGLRLVMLECSFCWLLWLSGSLWWGLLAWPWLWGWDVPVPTWSRSGCLMPKSQRSAPSIPPPPSTPPHSGRGTKGVERDLILSSLRCCSSGGLPAPH